MSTEILFKAIKVEDELPPYPQIVTILIDSRLPMMAQIRPSENGPEWWTLGMSEAKQLKKGVTHWLKRIDRDQYLSTVKPVEVMTWVEDGEVKEFVLTLAAAYAAACKDYWKAKGITSEEKLTEMAHSLKLIKEAGYFYESHMPSHPVIKWVKASDRLPEVNGDIVWRHVGITNKIHVGYKAMCGFYIKGIDYRPASEEIEWLDESEPTLATDKK